MFKVLVDDNAHYQDEDERYELGSFATRDEALAACRRIVDQYLAETHRPGMSATALFQAYKDWGEDPFIVPDEGPGHFSAWCYAQARCQEICGA